MCIGSLGRASCCGSGKSIQPSSRVSEKQLGFVVLVERDDFPKFPYIFCSLREVSSHQQESIFLTYLPIIDSVCIPILLKRRYIP